MFSFPQISVGFVTEDPDLHQKTVWVSVGLFSSYLDVCSLLFTRFQTNFSGLRLKTNLCVCVCGISRKRRGRSVCGLEEDLMGPVGICLAARVPVRALQVLVNTHCPALTWVTVRATEKPSALFKLSVTHTVRRWQVSHSTCVCVFSDAACPQRKNRCWVYSPFVVGFIWSTWLKVIGLVWITAIKRF